MKKIIYSLSLVSLSLSTFAQITILPGGNVGVGQSNPANAKLEILSTQTGNSFSASMGTTSPTLNIWQTSSTSYPGARNSLTYRYGSFEIYDLDNNQPRFWIDKTSGNVGIGTVTPGSNEKVTIIAGTKCALTTSVNQTDDYGFGQISYVTRALTKSWVVTSDGGSSHSFYVYGNGTVYALGQYTGSDLRMKENIRPIEEATVKILQLKGVHYDFKKEYGISQHQIGLIAQEVEKIVPEVVATNEDGTKAIAYQNLIPLLIEGFKEQQTQIEKLQEVVNTQQKVIESQQLDIGECCKISQNQNNSTSIPNGNLSNSPVLYQNNPNPFTEKTIIVYELPLTSESKSIVIFDMQGALIKTYTNLTSSEGKGSITINGNELKAGMYLYSLIIDGKEIDTKRMILTK